MSAQTKFSGPKLAAFILCAVLAVAGGAPATAHAQPQASQTISLSPGASITIVLRENPSTGFKWRLNKAQSTDLGIIHVIDRGYQVSQNGLIGAPGSRRWEIRARAPGTASVVFTYARPWEHRPPAEAPAETHVVQVNIALRP
jgi:inhibitor of cysteine peptidase